MLIAPHRPVENAASEIQNCCRLHPESGVVVAQVPHDAGHGPSAIRFFQQLQSHLLDSQSPRVLIDFSAIRSVESSILAELVELNRRVAAVSGKVCFGGFTTVVRETLRQTRLDSILLVRDDIESGINSLTATVAAD